MFPARYLLSFLTLLVSLLADVRGSVTLSLGGGTFTSGTISGGSFTLVGGGSLNTGGGVIIINPPPPLVGGGSFQSPSAGQLEIFTAPIREGSAAISEVGDLPADVSPVAAVADDLKTYVVTKDGGAFTVGAIVAFPHGGSAGEVIHSFPQAEGLPGRGLLLKNGWLYGTTVANHATTGSTVFRFNLATRAIETVAVLPPNAESIPVSLAFAPNGDLYVLTSAIAGSRTLWFTSSFFQTTVLNFPADAETGALYRLPVAGRIELAHTFRPGGLPGMTTAALNVPSEIVCDTDGILYGTTTGRRLFTLVPGQPVQWMAGNTEDALGEGNYGTFYVWYTTMNLGAVPSSGKAVFKDRRVPLHVTPYGIRFHPSSRGSAPTQALIGGSMHNVQTEKWPSELEYATHLFSAGDGLVVALLEAGDRRRLVLASSVGGIRPLREIKGAGSGAVARAADGSVVASDVMSLSTDPAPQTGRLKKLTLALNTAPVCTTDYWEGADRLFMSLPHFYEVVQNDTDAEGDRLTMTGLTSPPALGLVFWASSPNTIGLTRLPTMPVFSFEGIYTVNDGFGGEATGIAVFRNRAPEPLVLNRPYKGTGIEVAASEFATDPDGDALSVKGIGEGATMELLSGGQSARIHPTRAGDIAVTVVDGLGAEAVATLRVGQAEPVAVMQTLYLPGSGGHVVFPDVGLAPPQFVATVVVQPQAGSVLLADGAAQYTAGKAFAGTDSFVYEIASPFGVLATVTVEVKDALPYLKGVYHAFGPQFHSLAKITVDARGRFTLAYRIGGRVYRKVGDLATTTEWRIPRGRAKLLIVVRMVASPDPTVEIRVGEEGGETTPLSLQSASELSALKAPRVHAEFKNTEVIDPDIVPGVIPGSFVLVGKPRFTPRPASYAIFMRASGGGVTIVGRLWNGRAWSASSIVRADGEMPIFGDYYRGSLWARASGNIVGSLDKQLQSKVRLVSTVGGSPYRQPNSGTNVFGARQTAVTERTFYPFAMTLSGTLGSDGRLTAPMPMGFGQYLQVRPLDGVLTGKITQWQSGASLPVNGLYIPHRNHVIGFAGDSDAKPITISKK